MKAIKEVAIYGTLAATLLMCLPVGAGEGYIEINGETFLYDEAGHERYRAQWIKEMDEQQSLDYAEGMVV